MSDVIRLHLNGGPRDDTYLDHWTTTLEVAALVGGINSLLAAEAKPVPTKKGRYVLRRDGLGNPVPHNLEGFVEADWQGWDA
jgi:hypothetical protein